MGSGTSKAPPSFYWSLEGSALAGSPQPLLNCLQLYIPFPVARLIVGGYLQVLDIHVGAKCDLLVAGETWDRRNKELEPQTYRGPAVITHVYPPYICYNLCTNPPDFHYPAYAHFEHLAPLNWYRYPSLDPGHPPQLQWYWYKDFDKAVKQYAPPTQLVWSCDERSLIGDLRPLQTILQALPSNIQSLILGEFIPVLTPKIGKTVSVYGGTFRNCDPTYNPVWWNSRWCRYKITDVAPSAVQIEGKIWAHLKCLSALNLTTRTETTYHSSYSEFLAQHPHLSWCPFDEKSD